MWPDKNVSRMRVAVDEAPRERHSTIESDGKVHDLTEVKTPRLKLLLIRQPGG